MMVELLLNEHTVCLQVTNNLMASVSVYQIWDSLDWLVYVSGFLVVEDLLCVVQ